MRFMGFSFYYDKLNNKEFTTIRKSRGGRYIGDDVLCRSSDRPPFVATVMDVKRLSLNEMTTEFLVHDSGKKTREEAIQWLNGFYQYPIRPDDKLYVFYMRRKELR
jgi:hypothetical protein